MTFLSETVHNVCLLNVVQVLEKGEEGDKGQKKRGRMGRTMVGKEEERMQESKENKKAEGKRQLLAALRERERIWQKG